MTTPKDGGKYSEAWTVRDEFAAKALQGYSSNASNLAVLAKDAREQGVSPVAHLALYSYEVADAMLAARESRP